MTVVTTRFSGRTFKTQEMRTVIPRRRQELVRKLLQEHRGQPSPREAAGPVEGASAGASAGAGGGECSERREHERHTETTSRTVQIPRPGCAPRGHDGLHPLDAALNLPLPRYRVEVRRRMTIATASRAPPRTALQFTALDIIQHGPPRAKRPRGVRHPSPGQSEGACRHWSGRPAHVHGAPRLACRFLHQRNGPELVDGIGTPAFR